MPDLRTVVLIVAAGQGKRFGSDLPKQYCPLAGATVLHHTVRAFVEHPEIDGVKLVIAEGYDEEVEASLTGLPREKFLGTITGGETRQVSVRRGLESLSSLAPELVLIHDGARPFPSSETTSAIIGALLDNIELDGACAALPVHDTLRRVLPDQRGMETVSREGLWRAQTPQGFRYRPILAAHQMVSRTDYTDDVAVAEAARLKTRLIEDKPTNIKITTPEDLKIAQSFLASTSPAAAAQPTGGATRVGMGYDVHRFEAGRPLFLCGFEVPGAPRGLKGHSDADVALHALTDAILGAIGEGDIGQHFPPSDDQWKDAPSSLFLEAARKRVTELGGRILNIDLTIICETPKIGPHRDAMRKRVAELLEVSEGGINIKATTTEGLGFTGREEGIAAQAVATLWLPDDAGEST